MSRQIVPASEFFIVDDDGTMREAPSVVFTLASYHVTMSADGESFIAGVRKRAPAAVLLNLHLPHKSGLSVLGAIDAQHFPARGLKLPCKRLERLPAAFDGGRRARH